MQEEKVTLEQLDKRLKHIERTGHIQLAFVILGFIGIISIDSIRRKLNK